MSAQLICGPKTIVDWFLRAWIFKANGFDLTPWLMKLVETGEIQIAPVRRSVTIRASLAAKKLNADSEELDAVI